MKVIFTFGGIPHYLSALLRKLQLHEDLEVCVVIPELKSKSIGEGVKLIDEEKGYKTIRLKEYNSCFNKPFFKGFLNLIKTEKPDLIVAGWPYILPLSLKLRILLYIKKNRIGLVFREIPFGVAPYKKALSYYRKNPWYDEDLNDATPKGIKFYIWAVMHNYLRKWYYMNIDASLAYAITAFEIHKSYGLKEEQIFVSCNSPDTEVLRAEMEKILSEKIELKYNPYRLVHIGRLIKWKRVDLLLDALGMLHEKFPEAELVIIGDGPEEENLKKQAGELSITGRVQFAGSLYKEDLARHVISSGIYVLAGMGGLSINEAMAFGKPVICSVCDGTEKTLVRDGYNGLFFESGNAESLAKKIEYLFNNQHLIELMGKNSEAIIRDEVNLNTVSGEFMRCFRYVYEIKEK